MGSFFENYSQYWIHTTVDEAGNSVVHLQYSYKEVEQFQSGVNVQVILDAIRVHHIAKFKAERAANGYT